MGGKKKGGLATRLARMSDEERAKYLQRKADAEEEARRRKEQLIENFMKNKLKKEDGFSRLNVAKINQYWHQVMRSEKCEYMKRDVEHLRRWMRRTVIIKTNIINKLMGELDWQEELYGKNFEAHSTHINNIIGSRLNISLPVLNGDVVEFHNKNLQQLSTQYTNDRKLLLFIGSNERQEMEEKNNNEIEYLMTIIYAQEVTSKSSETEFREQRINHINEVSSTYKMELREMQKNREKMICEFWKEISNIIRSYIQETDIKRFHLAELQKNDLNASLAISQYQHDIVKQEQELKKLQQEFDQLQTSQQEQIEHLEDIIKSTTKQFFQMRKILLRDINHDQQQLACLTSVSNDIIDYFKKVSLKGQQLLNLVESCQKLESQEEKMNKWTHFTEDEDMNEPGKSAQRSKSISSESSSVCEPITRLAKIRPKTSLPKQSQFKHMRQLKSEEIISKRDIFKISTYLANTTPVKEESITITKKSIIDKPSKSGLVAHAKLSRKFSSSEDFNEFDGLNKLDGLWWIYNKVELSCVEIRNEKKRLLHENKKLKMSIRDVLEASALGQSIPNIKSSSTATSRRRFVLSAPLSSCSTFS